MPKAHRPRLDHIDDVSAVVRAHLATSEADYANQALTVEMRQQRTEERARHLSDAFYGRDPAFKTTPWHSVLQLGYAFGDRVGIPGTPDEAMNVFWKKLEVDAQCYRERQRHGIIGRESLEFHIDVLIEEAAYALIGLPLFAD